MTLPTTLPDDIDHGRALVRAALGNGPRRTVLSLLLELEESRRRLAAADWLVQDYLTESDRLHAEIRRLRARLSMLEGR